MKPVVSPVSSACPSPTPRWARQGRWRLFERLPASTFTLVESVGLGYAGALLGRTCGLSSGTEEAHRSGWRAAEWQQLLPRLPNDREVRAELRQRGHDLPTHCHVLAGLHNTTTDEVQVFADEPLAAALQPNWQRLRLALDQAAALVRQERAAGLGLTTIMGQPVKLLDRLRQRARDWSQTRPEWGLANNAAFIAAPRARTRGVDLQGRAFLHDYEWQQDAEGAVLELIMTAPRINLQYFTSTTDNTRFGSGNKLLHNVVGGHIGVFEGNGGDLRIGLARQSLHDGQQWRHRPLRLHVVIEAPQAMIDRVIEKHAVVRDLVQHGWLYLLRMDGQPAHLERRTASGWQPLPGA